MNDRIRLQEIEQRLLMHNEQRARLEAKLVTGLFSEERAQIEQELAVLMEAHDQDVRRTLGEQPLLGLYKFIGILKGCQEDVDIMASPVPAALIPDLVEKLTGVNLTDTSQIPVLTTGAQLERRSAGEVLAEQRASLIETYGAMMQTMLLCTGGLPAEAKLILEAGGRVGMEATTDAQGELAVALVAISDGARRVVARVEAPTTHAGSQTRH